ncbi:hypothetical protein 32HC_63 [Mycobacterium phage 32HC]|uniref:Uncharacterized protein n=1 Tax=Mycobacterium phage 32HC TaxID=1445729 RepID=W8EG73_9CAUD|nr:hypothetical protein ST32HC_63 [Mycobacterium phage 32HC]AHJ86341.1 hypothetical protein 32HC_63 [Mycobacterium phage 32HC]
MSLLSGISQAGDLVKLGQQGMKLGARAIELGERAVVALERVANAMDCLAEAHGFVPAEPVDRPSL